MNSFTGAQWYGAEPMSGKQYMSYLHIFIMQTMNTTHIISSKQRCSFDMTALCPICTSRLVCYRRRSKVTPWKRHCAALQYILTSPKPCSEHLIMLSRCRDRLTLDFAHAGGHSMFWAPTCPKQAKKKQDSPTSSTSRHLHWLLHVHAVIALTSFAL